MSFNLQTYPGDNDAVAQVILGRADVGPHPGHVLRVPGQGASRQDRGRHTRSRRRTPSAIYFRKGDPLGAKLRAGVAKLKRNGTLMRLARKYKIPVSDVK